MRLSFPHMGTTYIPVKALFTHLGVDVIIPPVSSKRTLSLGARHSPEFVCLPFKLMMGNFIEALEMGADTLLMVGGSGLCRLSYYAGLLEQKLRDLGYHFEMITTALFEKRIFGVPDFLRLVVPDASLSHIWAAVRFALAKVNCLDDVESVLHKVRPREQGKGTADKIWQEAVEAIDQANDLATLDSVRQEYVAKLHGVPQDLTVDPLRVGIIGEFYVVLEPFTNLDLEKELGKLGVEVHRTIMLSEWTKFSIILSALGFSHHKRVHEAAWPYLKRDVGGDGWESVGETVLHARHGYDGMVHLAPFTCMPEVIAQNILTKVSRENGIPVLTITCDEQMGRTGLITRLEAFVDLLQRRRANTLSQEVRGR
ncbi:MAG: acyl-CoA dehydratase activase-related protein [Anaerolineae bacterium]